jgi:hypothetical protein
MLLLHTTDLNFSRRAATNYNSESVFVIVWFLLQLDCHQGLTCFTGLLGFSDI